MNECPFPYMDLNIYILNLFEDECVHLKIIFFNIGDICDCYAWGNYHHCQETC
jgi:hypothetical protein